MIKKSTKALAKGTDKGYIKGAIKDTLPSEVVMFKKTLNVTELKRDINDILGELGGEDALQVVHRGKSIKVIITQERYFKLLGLIDRLNAKSIADDELIGNESVATRKQRLKKKLEQSGDGDKQKNDILAERRISSP